jgi:DNA-directed RNA polymerase specialized sigma subunit
MSSWNIVEFRDEVMIRIFDDTPFEEDEENNGKIIILKRDNAIDFAKEILKDLNEQSENKTKAIGNIKITPYALELKKKLKAKDEECIKILDELASCIGNISVSDSLEKLDFVYLRKSEIDEANRKLIKAKEKIQDLKEKEE